MSDQQQKFDLPTQKPRQIQIHRRDVEKSLHDSTHNPYGLSEQALSVEQALQTALSVVKTKPLDEKSASSSEVIPVQSTDMIVSSLSNKHKIQLAREDPLPTTAKQQQLFAISTKTGTVYELQRDNVHNESNITSSSPRGVKPSTPSEDNSTQPLTDFTIDGKQISIDNLTKPLELYNRFTQLTEMAEKLQQKEEQRLKILKIPTKIAT